MHTYYTYTFSSAQPPIDLQRNECACRKYTHACVIVKASDVWARASCIHNICIHVVPQALECACIHKVLLVRYTLYFKFDKTKIKSNVQYTNVQHIETTAGQLLLQLHMAAVALERAYCECAFSSRVLETGACRNRTRHGARHLNVKTMRCTERNSHTQTDCTEPRSMLCYAALRICVWRVCVLFSARKLDALQLYLYLSSCAEMLIQCSCCCCCFVRFD